MPLPMVDPTRTAAALQTPSRRGRRSGAKTLACEGPESTWLPRHARAAPHEETERPVGCSAHPDSSRYAHLRIWNSPSPTQLKGRTGKIVAIERTTDVEGLAETSGPRRQRFRSPPAPRHLLLPHQRIQSTQQHGLRIAFLARNHISAPMHPESAVDVGPAGGAEHRSVPPRPANPGGCVGSGVVPPPVGLGLYDHAASRDSTYIGNEHRAQ